MKQTINGVSYHYEIYGEGEPLVLLHGFTGNIATWEPFQKTWGKSFQLIMVDILGHGLTDSPSDPKRYEIDQVASDLKDLLLGLNIESSHILGYSMGGRLALTFACKYPETVKSLILVSSSPGLRTIEERQNRIEQDEKLAERIELQGIKAFVDYWENIPLFITVKETPQAVQEAIRRERLQQKEMGLSNSLRGMGTGKQPSNWGCLPELNVPVLLLSGSKDTKFVKIADEMEQLVTNVKKKVIQEAGHMIQVEKQDLFEEIIMDWLIQFQNNKGGIFNG